MLSLAEIIAFDDTIILMVATLAIPARLIEYPDDVSGCSRLTVGGKDLLYYTIQTRPGFTSGLIVLILGYESGKKQDIITKDLIEPIEKEDRQDIASKVTASLANQPISSVLFL